MKQLCIKLACLLALCLMGITQLSAQIVVFQYRHVPAENVEEFLHRETTYWSEIAQQSINEGKMEWWGLYQKVGGWDLAGGSNYLFINVFEKPEDLNNMGAVWNPSKAFPKMRPADISTDHLGTVNHMIIINGVARVGEATSPFIRINYAKASNMTRYLELEQSVWQPFIKQQIESKKTTQLTWRLGQLIMPAGTDLPFNSLTVDGYKTLSEAVAPETAMSEGVEYPDFTGLNEVHEKVRIQVYGLVKATIRAE